MKKIIFVFLAVFSFSSQAEKLEYHFSHPNAFGWFSIDLEQAELENAFNRSLQANNTNVSASDFTDAVGPNFTTYSPMDIFDYEITVAFPVNSFVRTFDNSQTDNHNRNGNLSVHTSPFNSNLTFSVYDFTLNRSEVQLNFSEPVGGLFTEPTFQELLDAVDGIYPESLQLPTGDALAAVGDLKFQVLLSGIELINDEGLVMLSGENWAAHPVPLPAPFLLLGSALAGLGFFKRRTK